MKYTVFGKNILGQIETVHVNANNPNMAIWVVSSCSPHLDPMTLTLVPFLEPIDETNVIRVDFQSRKRI